MNILIVTFILLVVLEFTFPFLKTKKVEHHDLYNYILGGLNTSLSFSLYFLLLFPLIRFAENGNMGILNLFNLNYLIRGLIVFLILDCVNYIWHRILHENNFLFRFHFIHHSDDFLSLSSAFRFHFFEVLLGYLFKIPFILIAGITLRDLFIYQIIFSICNYFQHSNLNIPYKLDLFISKLIITPYLHRIHHSKIKQQSFSNYSTVLVLWDKAFRTFYKQDLKANSSYGVGNIDLSKYTKLKVLLKQPFKGKI